MEVEVAVVGGCAMPESRLMSSESCDSLSTGLLGGAGAGDDDGDGDVRGLLYDLVFGGGLEWDVERENGRDPLSAVAGELGFD